MMRRPLSGVAARAAEQAPWAALPLWLLLMLVLTLLLPPGCSRGADGEASGPRVTEEVTASAAPGDHTQAPATASGAGDSNGADGPRIISVGGAVTETVFALGAGDQLVAIDTSSVYPEATEQIAKVGYQRLLAAEPILAHRPDLLLVSHEAGPKVVLDQLAGAGVKVLALEEVRSIADAAARIRAIGDAIGKQDAGDALAATVEHDANAASERARAAPSSARVLFIYARGPGMMMVAGRDTVVADMLGLVGAELASDSFDGFRPLSAEGAIAAAPDAILVPTRGLASLGDIDGLLAQPGISQTPAGKQRHVIAMDDLLLLGLGPRLPLAIDQLAAKLAK